MLFLQILSILNLLICYSLLDVYEEEGDVKLCITDGLCTVVKLTSGGSVINWATLL